MSNYFGYIAASYICALLILGAYLWTVMRRHQAILRQIRFELADVDQT